HRPSILETVDKVLVLNHGAQDLFGPRDAVFGELANRARRVTQMPRATPKVVKDVQDTQEAKEA
ncbi:type I secretion system permease/ATPase, partial [Mesorhizobium sp. M4A.F.Ca.ET.022.05.2.1]